MEVDRNGMQILDVEECAVLLSSTRVGRLAITHRALPVIVPVVFAYDRGDVIFGVGPGALAHAAAAGQIVCFEADGADSGFTSMWSVSMTGPLAVVAAPLDEAVIHRLDVGPWTKISRVFVRLSCVLCTGRSWTAASPPAHLAGASAAGERVRNGT